MKSFALLLAAALTSAAVLAATDRTATLDVTNMDCAVCPITVRKALEKVPGVGSAKVDFKTKRAVVAFDPAKTTPEALTRATYDAGFPSSVTQVQ
jgi:mercuric ion binding protein